MDSPSLKKDIQSILKIGGILAVLVTLPMTTLPALGNWLIARLWEKVEPAAVLGKVALLTAPLTASLALIGLGVLRGWFAKFWQFLVVLGLTLVINAMIGEFLGLLSMEQVHAVADHLPKSGGVPIWTGFMLSVSTLMAYQKIYGFGLFYSSLAVGAFLAWAWGARLLPHLNNRPVRIEPFAGFVAFVALVPALTLLPLAGYFESPPPSLLRREVDSLLKEPKLAPLVPTPAPFSPVVDGSFTPNRVIIPDDLKLTPKRPGGN